MSIALPVSTVSVQKKTTIYNDFKGVDFSVDPSLVERYRSPYAPNLISDIGGMPEKRIGYRTIATVDSPINGIYKGTVGSNNEVFVVHGGTKLYSLTLADGEYTATAIETDINNGKSSGFFMDDGDGSKLYILTGAEYLCYDGTVVTAVSNNAYIPTLFISRDPNGGGTPSEEINLLGAGRKEQFLGNTTDTVYYLSAEDIDSVDKVEVMNDSGVMVEYTATTGTPGANQYKANLINGTVTFNAAKPPVVTGRDNIYVTYSKAIEGNADKIEKCTIVSLYGYEGDNRVFVSGNPDNPAYDRYSDVYRPNYFPERGYTIVGSDDTAVMGYLKLGQYQLIVKEDSSTSSTLLQRHGGKDNDGDTVFYIEQGVTGLGAASKYCFGSLIDEPLFLSRQGIMGIYSTNILAERSFKNRSFFVNSKLINESDLQNACACEWNGYFLVAVNGHAYILDSKNKAYLAHQSNTSSDYLYECYYWDSIPARVLFEQAGELYFGADDGRICKFNTDIEGLRRYNDDGAAISCSWATKNDDDGASHLYKTMQKRGCSITIKPFVRSSAKIYVSKDGNPEEAVRSANMDIFTFDDFSFERLSFNTNDSPQDIYLKKKVKKYKRLQIMIVNDTANEGFGIFQITKTFSIGNYAKK